MGIQKQKNILKEYEIKKQRGNMEKIMTGLIGVIMERNTKLLKQC